MNRRARIIGVGTALPEHSRTQAQIWDEFFSHHYDGNRLARRIWLRCGVERRYGVVDPVEASAWGTGARMRRFIEEAVPLGKRALEACLADAGLEPADVGLLTVVSCTGYATPGLDILLARELGMNDALERLHVGHMGCYAALPGLAAASDAAAARSKTALLLSVELTTLHTQPATDEIEQIVAHALFSDAAAAVAVAPEGPGLELVDVVARTDVDRAELMTWDVTDLGFRMGLSPRVPAVVEEHARPVVEELLGRHQLGVDDVACWIVHPGGPRILDVVARSLVIDPEVLHASRDVLRDFGNCSSATVLLILDRILADDELEAGAPLVLMAFGPGLTLYAALLRRSGE